MTVKRPLYFLAALAIVAVPVTAAVVTNAQSSGRPVTGECDPPETDGSTDCLIHIAGVEVLPSTTVPATSTSSSSSTSTPPTTAAPTTVAPTSTVAPTTDPPTTVAPSSTTTQPPSTTSTTSSSTSTTTSVPTPTSTAPPSGVAFSEDFSTPGAFSTRFDHGLAGGPVSGDVPGDHDMSCGAPTTQRTIHMGTEDQFWYCAPGGPAGGHVMTGVNTEGYNIAWFSPKQAFTNVRQVCVDQNLTNLGGGKWTQVIFLTPDQYQGKTNLGFTSPEFPNDQLADANDRPADGPETQSGSARVGWKLEYTNWYFWQVPAGANPNNDRWRDPGFNPYKQGTIMSFLSAGGVPRTADKAARYPMCIRDNENGSVTGYVLAPGGSLRADGTPDGTVLVHGAVSGSIPDGPVRVVFEDDNYNDDKHNGDIPHNTGAGYTWHWDNIQITTR